MTGLLSETDKSRLMFFGRKAKQHGLCHSDLFISELVDRTDRNWILDDSRLLSPMEIYSMNTFGEQLSKHSTQQTVLMRRVRWCELGKKVKVDHTRLPSVGFWSWSQFLAVSLQVTWVINLAVGCHYFPPGLQLPPQPSRGLLPISLLMMHNGCEQFA